MNLQSMKYVVEYRPSNNLFDARDLIKKNQ